MGQMEGSVLLTMVALRGVHSCPHLLHLNTAGGSPQRGHMPRYSLHTTQTLQPLQNNICLPCLPVDVIMSSWRSVHIYLCIGSGQKKRRMIFGRGTHRDRGRGQGATNCHGIVDRWRQTYIDAAGMLFGGCMVREGYMFRKREGGEMYVFRERIYVFRERIYV